MTDTPAVDEFTELMQDEAAREAFVQVKMERSPGAGARRYRHILQAVTSVPWAITESKFEVIMDVLRMRAAGFQFSAEELHSRLEAARRRDPADSRPGVAVIPLSGVIVPKADMFSEMSGGTSIDAFRSMWREAMAMDQVKAVVLDVDSPGGMVTGVPEMAAEMRASRGRKPVVAVANSEMASGAYWLASQADQIVVSASSMIGSIGVFTRHENESAKAERDGVETTYISAGKFKTEGNPHAALTDEAKAHVQGIVDEHYGMFVKDVARGRGVPVAQVRGGYGEGRVVTGSTALSLGMADSEGSVESVVRSLMRSTDEGSNAAEAEGRLYVSVIPGIVGDGSGEALPPIPSDDMTDPELVALNEAREHAGLLALTHQTVITDSANTGAVAGGHSPDDADDEDALQDGPAAVVASGNDAPASPEDVEELELRNRLAALQARRS